ncbi:hypothetical protein Agub_g5580 [Astrephomene gubernaculifera]|uniref:MORN repeat-containing protein 1 n=1 Tax=Astrephomene gubernaculifera TaxID=47775 RepID=A0AAD3HK77_9CHLO|nr:hypothetical protein Agub_g5580 [Astrephomene gubernaculifera]
MSSASSPAAPTADGPAGSNTFYTAPSLGAGLRGIELDRCYVGDYVGGRRHGFGTYTYPNSFFQYEGQWVNGKKHGLGKLTMRDGAYYEGEFVEGEIMGQGTRRFANGDVYIGSFEMGEMHGFGVMRLANGDMYKGPFVHNAFEGVGVYTHAQGDVFQGEFVRHKRRGHGVLTCADGSRYEGGWSDNQRSGQGEATYSDGSRYRGSWERSRYQGQGEWFQAATGLTYRGVFEGGQPAQVPSALTITWVAEEDPKGRGKRAAGGGGRGSDSDGVTPLPIVLGEPCPLPITIAAQLQEPLPPSASTELSAPPDARGKAGAKSPPGTTGLRVLVQNQPPEPGHVWRTAEMEWGRQVNLTLHAEPPRPLPPGRLLRVLLVHTLMPDGATTRVRLLLNTAEVLGPPLPLARVQGQLVASMQVELQAGQRVVEGLVIGSAEDTERLVLPAGVGFLVASTAGGRVAAGVCRVALPEPKGSKKPGGR